MDMKIVLPKDTVSATTCALCGNYLSVPPVLGLCDEGKQYRCGRCKDVVYKTYARNFCYENVAKHLVFPCIYEQCEKKIPWGQVEDHEKVCSYRTISCPVYWECNKSMQISEFELHFKRTHSEYFVCKNFVRTVKVNFTYVFLLVVNEQWFFVYVCANKTSSYVSIYSLSPLTHSARYNLQLTSENNSCYISYKNQNIFTFDERRHCLKCIRKDGCHVKHHPFSQCYNRQGGNVHFMTTNLGKMTSILDVLGNPESVKVTIDLVEEEGVSEKKESCEPKNAGY